MSGRLAGWLGLSALVVALDQWSKHAVLGRLVFGENVSVTDFFSLVLVYNPGAAFSFLADHSGWQRWFFVFLAIGISGWLLVLLRRHQQEIAQPFAFAMIIGGAIGNVIDRLLYGAVVDFLYFHVGRYGWPAFNLADSAITLGVLVMLSTQFRRPADPSAQEKRS